VITSGLTPAQETALLEATRQGSMRLVGPGSFGVAVPGIGLEATFAVHHPSPGKTGLGVQSGGVGAALVEQFSRLGCCAATATATATARPCPRTPTPKRPPRR